MGKKETAITKKITRWLDSQAQAGVPVWYFKVHGGPVQKAGIPDICVVYYGLAVFLEVKTEMGVASPLQKKTIERIREAKGTAQVVKNLEDVKLLLDRTLLTFGMGAK